MDTRGGNEKQDGHPQANGHQNESRRRPSKCPASGWQITGGSRTTDGHMGARSSHHGISAPGASCLSCGWAHRDYPVTPFSAVALAVALTVSLSIPTIERTEVGEVMETSTVTVLPEIWTLPGCPVTCR
jgi:hypothetical protein